MWDNNGTTYQRGNTHGFIDLLGRDPGFLTFAQVILHTVIAAEYQRSRQAYQFFGLDIQYPGRIGIRVKIEYSFQDQIIGGGNLVIHPLPVFIKLSDDVHGLEV